MERIMGIKLNRVQEYFTTIFSHDLSDKDFKELQQVVSGWLASKVRETAPSDLQNTVIAMEEIEPNKVQEYFISVFPHDLPDEDFKEIKDLVIQWLFVKARGH